MSFSLKCSVLSFSLCYFHSVEKNISVIYLRKFYLWRAFFNEEIVRQHVTNDTWHLHQRVTNGSWYLQSWLENEAKAPLTNLLKGCPQNIREEKELHLNQKCHNKIIHPSKVNFSISIDIINTCAIIPYKASRLLKQ